ncbi:pro-corazonin-like [Anopheles ziemanni]|uniref:pro-corazonin-like n=1 Tax=Anopheles coustani TaxID=139045 RepID=UPI00265B2F59|nr:pro-corazonin-like [Anopheles coustani]XP_058174876.1 pro-corazonin-like [Anopheles ziemanni]
MLHTRTIALLMAGLVVLVNAQTFQYSRGWTNGKRSSSSDTTPNQVLVSRIPPGGLDLLKASEKALLRRFLRNPCDLRIANLLAGHQSKDLLQLGNDFDSSEAAGAPFVLPPFLIDPDEANAGAANGATSGNQLLNGRTTGDELRYKREIATGTHQKLA